MRRAAPASSGVVGGGSDEAAAATTLTPPGRGCHRLGRRLVASFRHQHHRASSSGSGSSGGGIPSSSRCRGGARDGTSAAAAASRARAERAGRAGVVRRRAAGARRGRRHALPAGKADEEGEALATTTARRINATDGWPRASPAPIVCLRFECTPPDLRSAPPPYRLPGGCPPRPLRLVRVSCSPAAPWALAWRRGGQRAAWRCRRLPLPLLPLHRPGDEGNLRDEYAASDAVQAAEGLTVRLAVGGCACAAPDAPAAAVPLHQRLARRHGQAQPPEPHDRGHGRHSRSPRGRDLDRGWRSRHEGAQGTKGRERGLCRVMRPRRLIPGRLPPPRAPWPRRRSTRCRARRSRSRRPP